MNIIQLLSTRRFAKPSFFGKHKPWLYHSLVFIAFLFCSFDSFGQPDIDAASVPPNGMVCVDEEFELTAQIQSGPVDTWAWTLTSAPAGSTAPSNAGSTEDVIVSGLAVAGTYTYTVVATNNTTGSSDPKTVEITVIAPPVIATFIDPVEVCEGGILELPDASLNTTAGAGTVTWMWTDFNGNSIPGTGPQPPLSTAPPIIGNVSTQYTYQVVAIEDGCPSDAVEVNVIVHPPPEVTFTEDGSVCEGATVELMGTSPNTPNDPNVGPNTTAPWTLEDPNGNIITSNTTPFTQTVSDAGTYTLTFVDDNGCSREEKTTVVIYPLPEVTAPDDFSICVGEELELEGVSPTANLWSWSGPVGSTHPATSPSPNNPTIISPVATTDAGTYTVMVTDNNNCSATADVIVTINTPPTPPIVDDITVCEGDQIDLTTRNPVTGTLSWTDPSGAALTGQSPTVTTSASLSDAGMYTVTLTDNGCTSTAELEVTVNPELDVTIESSGLCDGGNTDLTATTSNGTPVSWAWTDPSGTVSSTTSAVLPNQGTPGTYTVTVTDGNSPACTGTSTITISENPIPKLITPTISDNEVCEGEEVTLRIVFDRDGTSNSVRQQDWVWTDPFGNAISDANGNPIAPIINGTVGRIVFPAIAHPPTSPTSTYTVMITDNNGCTTEHEFDITVHEAPDISAGSSAPLCLGDDLVLAAGFNPSSSSSTTSATATYAWSGPGFSATIQNPTNPSVFASSAGPYTVTVTDDNGCTAQSTEIVEIAQPTVTATNTSAVCIGERIDFTGTFTSNGAPTTAQSWAWTAPAGAALLNPSLATPAINSATLADAGTYTVVVTDNLNCTATTMTTVVVNELPEVESVTLEVCEDENGDLTFNLEEAESTGGSNIGTDPVFNGTATINYFLEAGLSTPVPTPITAYTIPATSAPAVVYAEVEVNGCTRVAMINLVKADAPTGTNNIALQNCDDGTGSTTINLTDAESPNTGTNNSAFDVDGDGAVGSTPGTVTYFTSSGTQLSNSQAAAYSISNTETITARITNGDGCYVEQDVVLTIAELPDGTPITLRACDDGNDEINFDLTQADIDGDGTAGIPTTTGFSAMYYTGTPIGPSTEIPIPAAHAAGDEDVIIAVLENPDGCVQQTTISIEFDDPIANPLTLKLCNDFDGDGMVDFNLNDALDPTKTTNIDGNGGVGIDVRGGNFSNPVTFFQSDGVTLIDASTTPSISAFTVPVTGGSVIAEISSGTGCKSRAIITLEVSEPTTNPVTLELCEEGNGRATFDLSAAVNSGDPSNVTGMAIDDGSSMSISYNEANDANPQTNGQTNIMNFTNYMSGSTTVFAIVKGLDGCEAIEEIDLVVLTLPTVAPTELTLCETVAGGGTAVFDLTHAEDPIGTTNTGGVAVNTNSGHTVTYTTASGMVIPTTGTQSESTYAASDGDIVTAVVMDPTTGCIKEAEVTLNVISAPEVTNVTLEGCDDGDGEIDFDLTTADIDGDGNSGGFTTGGFTVNYYTASPPGGTLIPSSGTINTSAYPAQTGDMVVAVISKDGCESESIITFNITTPIANDVVLRLCDDPDLATNTSSFDLMDALDDTATDNGMSVNGASTTNTVLFFDPNSATPNTPLSSPYIATDGDMIEAVVTDPVTTCMNTAEVTFMVDSPPIINPVTLEVCEDDPNAAISMGTFTLEDAEVVGGSSSNTGNTAVDNGSTSTTVSYFDNSIASGMAAAISSPHLAADGTMIYAVVTDTQTGCESEIAVMLTTRPAPTFTNMTLQLCNDGTNSALFDLEDAETANSPSNPTTNTINNNNGITGNIVQYLNPNGTPIIGTTVNSYPASGGDMITAVIMGSNGCTSEATITFKLLAPTVRDVTLSLCDDSDGLYDNLATFDLDKAEVANDPSNISNLAVSMGHMVTYHIVTPALGTSAILPSANPQLTAVNNTPVYALVDSMGCFSEATITLLVNAPEANDYTLTECGIGTQVFDLTEANEDVNGSTGLNVTYFELNGTPILPPQQYSASNGHTIIARVTGLDRCTNESTVTLSVSNPSITAATTTPNVCEEENINLTSMFTAGASNTVTYSWTHPINGVVSTAANDVITAGANSGGTYTVVATDANGCTATAMVSVTVNELPTVAISASREGVCVDDDTGTITFTGMPTPTTGTSGTFNTTSSGLTPTSTGTATLDISQAGMGIHMISYTYKDVNDCEVTATSTIEIYELPTGGAIDTEVCIGESVSVDGLPSGGSNSFTGHNWIVSGAGGTGATNANLTTSNAQTAVFDATGLSAGTVTLEYMVTDDNTCIGSSKVDIVIHDNPVSNLLSDTMLCVGSSIIIDGDPSGGSGTYSNHDWSINTAAGTGATNANLINPTTDMVTFDATGLSVGTVVVDYTFTDDNGCMGTAQINVEILPLPNPILTPSVCTDDLMFSIGVQLTDHDTIVSVMSGTLSIVGTDINGLDSFDVSGLSTGTRLFITVVDTLTGCVVLDSTDIITCECPTINRPTIVSAENACAGDSSLLVVAVDSTETVDWFLGPLGGTAFLSGVDSFLATVPDIYFVETRDLITGCTSAVRLRVPFDIYPEITLSEVSAICSEDFSNYTVIATTSGDNIIANIGTVTSLGSSATIDSFEITNIPFGTDVILTGVNTTGCSISDTITAPECVCPTLEVPNLGNDITICSAEAIPSFSSDVDANQTIIWYNAGGTVLDTAFTFTPASAGIFVAEALDTLTNCTSDGDTIVLLIHPSPVITYVDTTCNISLDSLELELTITADDTITTNVGTVTILGTTVTISGVPDASPLFLTVVDTVTMCEVRDTFMFNCDCITPTIAPVAIVDTITTCPGINDTLLVSVDSTETTDWYDSTGMLVNMGDTSFITSTPGIYFVVTRDTISGCESVDSTPVVLLNHPVPMASILNNQGSYCVGDSIELIGDTVANVVYAWTSSNTGTFNDTTLQHPIIYGASNGEVITLTITDTITGCSNAVMDTILVDTIPSITGIMSTCDADLDSFSLQIFTNATNLTIMSAHGAIAPGTNPYTIVGIPADSTVFIQLSIGNGCILDTLIAAPSCDCPIVNIPIVTDTFLVCPGDTLPDLIAQVDSTETVDWYSTATATGTPLLVGNTTFTPTAVGTYYALTRDTITGCTSDTTSAIVVANTILPSFDAIASTDICPADSVLLMATNVTGTVVSWQWSTTGSGGITNPTASMTMAGGVANGDQFILQGTDASGCIVTDTTNAVIVNPAPALDTFYTECTADLNNYNVIVVAQNGTLTSNVGTISNISIDTFQILLIPTGTDVTITFTDATFNCALVQTIISPNCACPQTLTAPTVGDLTICKDETPLFSAQVGLGETVNWFDTIVGGTPITTNPNFTSPETLPGTYTYYAQTVNSINGCVSFPRTPITLTILPLPEPNLNAVTTICSGTTTTLTPGLFNSYFWSTGDTTATIAVGAGQYFVTVTDANGCSAVQAATVNEDAGVAVSLSVLPMACTSDGLLPLLGSPTGGAFNGPGVTGSTFNPAIAGPGTHTITYSIGGDCNGVSTAQIEVMSPAATNLTIANTSFCSTDASITLNGGTPSGGIYSGTGVNGTTFDPTLAGIGTHTIIYTNGTGTSCETSDTIFVSVIDIPAVSFTPGNTTTLCNTGAAVTLTGGSPAGGTYSGTGVTGGVFNPTVAGIGTHTITYTVVSGGCTGTASTTYTVTGEPTVSLALGTPSVCNNGGSITLSGGSPAGGTYSGTGVTGGVFNPAGLGAGNYTITYQYAAAGGCTGVASATLTVRPTSAVTFNLNNIQLCANSGLYTLGGASPGGGSFSGPGVVGNIFNPTTAGVGSHTITYTGPASGCSGTATATLTVLSPDISTSLNVNAPTLCSNSGAFTLGGGSPAGGTYSGTGVVNGQFDPSISGAGAFTISYSTICGTAVDVINVQQELAVSLALTKNSACSNEGSFVLSGGSPAGGTFSGPGVSGNNNFNPAIVGPGNHTVTYTVNPGSGCTGTATAIISVSNPTTIQSAFSLNVPQLCATSGAFVLSGGSPAGGVYSGSGVINGTTFDPSQAGAGTHTITYSLSGCSSGSSTATIIVDAAPPIPELRMASQICIGEDLQLEASAIPGATSYSWSGPNGFTSVFQNPVIPNVTAANAGQYNLVVGVGNCASSMSSLNVSVTSLPQAVSVSNGGAVCQGSDFTLRVDSPIQGDIYNWFYQNGAFVGTGTGLNLSSTQYDAGRYYVTVTRGGCIYNPITDFTAPTFAFTDVVISNQVAVGAFAGDDVTVCEDSYDLNPLLPTNNQNVFGFWSTPIGSKTVIADPNQFNSPVFNLEPGNNIFIWTLSNAGCSGLSSDTLIVNYAAPPVLTNDNFNTTFGESVQFDPLENDPFLTGFFLDSIFTSDNGTAVINGDGTVSYIPNNTFAGTDQLTYRVCSSTCPTVCTTATIGIDVQVNSDIANIILPNTITPNGDGVNDALIIPELLEYPGSELVIFNRWGDEVFRSNDYQNDWFGFWQENNELLPVGTYFYVITLSDSARSRLSGYVYVQRD